MGGSVRTSLKRAKSFEKRGYAVFLRRADGTMLSPKVIKLTDLAALVRERQRLSDFEQSEQDDRIIEGQRGGSFRLRWYVGRSGGAEVLKAEVVVGRLKSLEAGVGKPTRVILRVAAK